MNTLRRLVFLFLIFTSLLCGCATLRDTTRVLSSIGSSMYSPRHYSSDKSMAMLIEAFKKEPNKSYTIAERNNLVFLGIAVINRDYIRYVDFMTQSRAGFITGSEIGALGTTTAATIVTPPGTKTILSGISAIILGSKSSIEKNFYQEVSFFVLNARMRAERGKVLADIMKRVGEDIDAYPMSQVLVDLDRYYAAGTVLNSFAINYDQATKEEQEAKFKVEAWPDILKKIEAEVKKALKN